jgi:hypothetical protein
VERVHRFLDNPRGHGNVVFNFEGRPVEDLTAFAEGYHVAGKVLAEKLASDEGYADYEGYPILFLYRHALELYLKAVVYRGAMLLGLVSERRIDTTRLFTRHELVPLLPHVKAIWETQAWGFEGSDLTSFDDFADLIHSLENVDPQSYAFRYPINRTGEAHLPHHFVVNVVSFARSMDGLLHLLRGATVGLKEEFQLEAQARYELEHFLEDHDHA